VAFMVEPQIMQALVLTPKMTDRLGDFEHPFITSSNWM
jgi:hypothetical protein